jgi:hypothetical protein
LVFPESAPVLFQHCFLFVFLSIRLLPFNFSP